MKIEKGNLVIDIRNLLSGMAGDARRELIQALACDEQVMAEVASQIVTGWTSDGWSAGQSSFSIEPWCALDVAIRRVAEASSDIAKKEIERANREIERWKQKDAEAQKRYDALLGRLDMLTGEVRLFLDEYRDADGCFVLEDAMKRLRSSGVSR